MYVVDTSTDFQLGYQLGEETASTNPLLETWQVRNVAEKRLEDASRSMNLDSKPFCRGFLAGYRETLRQRREKNT